MFAKLYRTIHSRKLIVVIWFFIHIYMLTQGFYMYLFRTILEVSLFIIFCLSTLFNILNISIPFLRNFLVMLWIVSWAISHAMPSGSIELNSFALVAFLLIMLVLVWMFIWSFVALSKLLQKTTFKMSVKVNALIITTLRHQ